MSPAVASNGRLAAEAGLLRALGLKKRFGDLTALDDVDLELWQGDVHAVLGENGAGKSTLMNILSGILVPDEGTVLVDGRPVTFRCPKDAIRQGIGIVHQRPHLVSQLTVAENLALGDDTLPRIGGRRAHRRRAREYADRYGLSVDLDAVTGRLSLGEVRRVEILRLLMRDARVLILDEPTAVLTPHESDRLCSDLRDLAKEGRSVVFVSHKLAEVIAVADRVTVMRSGRRIASLRAEDCSVPRLAALMVGDAPLAETRGRSEVPPGRPMLVVEGLRVGRDSGHVEVREVDLTVREHEIVGVAGVAGNGQQELAEALTGLRPAAAGRILVGEEEMQGRSARNFHDVGVAHIPEDRWATGLVPGASIWRNAILRAYRREGIARGPLLSRVGAHRFARQICAQVRLSTEDLDTHVEQLSGGNAQRLLTGRELASGPRVLIAVHPTQGLDIRATADVRRALADARSAGLATLLISEDLDELLAISDRIVVMYEGSITGEFAADAAERDAIGLLMGGGHDALPAR